MKQTIKNQTSFVVEVVLQDDSPIFLVRDPRDGRFVRVVGSVLELTSFIQDLVDFLASPSQDCAK